MKIIGANLSHDASICLLVEGRVEVAIALERILRVKRAAVPLDTLTAALHDAFNDCLEQAGCDATEIDFFTAVGAVTKDPSDELELVKRLGLIPRGKIVTMPHPSHHLAHAYASFFTSGFPEAAALVIDSFGSILGNSRECESGFAFTGGEAKLLFRHTKPLTLLPRGKEGTLVVSGHLAGIGEIYRTVTLLLGFYHPGKEVDEAGKTMGLAPYGRLLSREPIFIRITDDGLDFSNVFPFLEAHNLVVKRGGYYFLSPRGSTTPFSQFHKDLAAQVQWEFEEACLALARRLRKTTGLDHLVMGGGAFLNSAANLRISRESGFKHVYIFPAATDDGTAVGAAYYASCVALESQGKTPAPLAIKNVFFGRDYPSDLVRPVLEGSGIMFEELESAEAAACRAAALLTQGNIIGWFQGRAEFGPRALGNRSILADPCLDGIKDVLNSRVKFREGFRPFAPAVLEEEAGKYFDLEAPSPYMLSICDVLPAFREKLSGITHIDGTARVQTVSRSFCPLLYTVLREIGRRTGIPVVLNTSFNLRGMPIVETPADALRCFLSTRMDYLIMDRFLMPAPDFGSFVPVRTATHVTTRSLWLSTQTDFPEDEVRLRSPTGHTAQVEPEILALLRAVDGRRTTRELAEETDSSLALEDIVDRLLALCRLGLVEWRPR